MENVIPHPNADKLDLVNVRGWQVISQKGKFTKGDSAVYLPIDSVLPPEFESWLFPPDSKVTLTKSRVRTIKLRGAISQGMLISIPAIHSYIGEDKVRKLSFEYGADLTSVLGITKYEPPTREQNALAGAGKRAGKYQRNPNFHKYTDIQNVKNYNKVFTEEDVVYMNEKIHGTNARAGWVKRYTKGFWGWVKKVLLGEYQFVYGSHNVQLQDKMNPKCFYEVNVYAEAVQEYNLKEVLQPGEVIYFEIYGDGIQKNYTYGCRPNERKIVVIDVEVNGEYLGYPELKEFCFLRKLPMSPPLYLGKFNLDLMKEKIKGNSVLAPRQKVMEGGVIRPAFTEERGYMGRKILKLISDDYLLQKSNSDLH